VAALEFALVLPLLVTLLLGVTTMGLAYSDHLSVTNAVRESARLGAGVDFVTSTTGPNPCPLCSPTAWGDAVQSRVQQAYFNSGSSISTSQICARLVDYNGGTDLAHPSTQGTACGTEPSVPSGLTSGTCVVKVWVRKPERVVLGILPDINFNVSAQSVSIYGRNTGVCSTP
jgi:hypothetical protein